jgi:methionyl-tRNA formyltransferase
MKIGYFGDGRWAQKSLRKILAMDGIEVTFIVPRFKNPDSELRKIADEEGIPFLVTKNVNTKEFIQLIDKYSADLFVSMSFDQILKEDFLRVPPKGTINCHAGALPFYRGRNVLNWVLINDEKSFGVTVHYVDKGIDTGDIMVMS